MRLIISILVLTILISNHCLANMASPIERGTMVSAPYSSKDINILSETIHIKIDKDFKTARFIVEYTIQSDKEGRQIPLLFYAKDYKDSFHVWLDNQEIKLQNIPEKYTTFEESPFSDFRHYLDGVYREPHQNVSISWIKNSNYILNINELKYFETEITTGVHKIKVEYTADSWIDHSDWVKEYSILYSLSPARFWKSFGTMTIYVEQIGEPKLYKTNLGEPIEKNIQKTNSWRFDNLPDEFIEVKYKPDTGKFAKMLIAFGPSNIAVIFGLLLVILHIYLVIIYRKGHPGNRFSAVVITGSLLVPLLFIICYIWSFGFIDGVIGENASRRHGYEFLTIIFYPVLLPFYWIVMWLIDKFQKRRLKKEAELNPNIN